MYLDKQFLTGKSLLIFILPILFFGITGCNGDDDDQTVTDLTPLEGNYVGTWNSTTPTTSYTDYPNSAILEVTAGNRLSGSWFSTANFEVCCSAGDNDGTIVMEISGNTINTFTLNDVITDCSGVFTGNGIIRESDNALVIDFTGTDCDGTHDGQLVLVKQ